MSLKFKILSAICLLTVSAQALAVSDEKAIEECLNRWKTAPFKPGPATKFRTLAPSVKIIGIGGRDLEDVVVTKEPELVLIKPSVNVMSKSVFRLMNPNAWYCFKSTTAVLGKAEIEVACKANVTSADDSQVGVLGAADKEGVAVLGSIRMKRVGCN